MREILQAVKEGDRKAKYAYDVYTYRIKKYIGAYAAAMGGVDVIVFTGGIGENAVQVRADVCNNMEYLGIKLSKERNENAKGEALITTDDSQTVVLKIPTNEELVIAMDTEKIVNENINN